MKGLRTEALIYLCKSEDGVTIYDMMKELGYNLGTASEILESFSLHGLALRRDSPGPRGAKPYDPTSEGRRLSEFMQHLESKNLLSPSIEPLFGDSTPEKTRFIANLAEGGFSEEDFQKALRFGLITRGRKLVLRRYQRGVFRLIPGLLILGAAWTLYALMSGLPSLVIRFLAIGVLVAILGVSLLLLSFLEIRLQLS